MELQRCEDSLAAPLRCFILGMLNPNPTPTPTPASSSTTSTTKRAEEHHVAPAAILDCLFARRPDLCKLPFNRSAIASLEKVPEDFPAERGSPAEQDNARDDEAHEQELVQELQSPSDGGGARVETSSM
jgi:hypothetical protein